MNEKKNIDRLFQERFKDFEVVPNDKIWNNIHSELHPKKKRRLIPLWWKFSGIAAGLVLAFFAYRTLSDNFLTLPAVVIAPKENDKNDVPKPVVPVEKQTSIAIENGNLTEEKPTNNQEGKALNTVQNSNKNSSNGVATSIKQKTSIQKNTTLTHLNKNSKLELDGKEDALQKGVADNSYNTNVINDNALESTNNNLEYNKQTTSIEKNFVTKNKIQIKKDSTAIALAETPNPLEEILKKKNEKEEVLAVAKVNRWQITTNVAPVYFNSASNGSPIESQFEENSKTYENNLSVGVGVQYAVNKKLAVRTGVNKVSLGYATNDVVFFGGLNTSGVSNLISSNPTSNIEVLSANNIDGLRPFEDNLQNTESGVLNQKMGYYEVPLELSYALVNRKFGIKVIGGLSTLFLNENSVSVQSSNTKMSLGKAENLNDIHFSGNAGLGFNYQFWNTFEAHFEPTFKYQFNTFSRDAGNFKPYFVGLYTGISFKF